MKHLVYSLLIITEQKKEAKKSHYHNERQRKEDAVLIHNERENGQKDVKTSATMSEWKNLFFEYR